MMETEHPLCCKLEVLCFPVVESGGEFPGPSGGVEVRL